MKERLTKKFTTTSAKSFGRKRPRFDIECIWDEIQSRNAFEQEDNPVVLEDNIVRFPRRLRVL